VNLFTFPAELAEGIVAFSPNVKMAQASLAALNEATGSQANGRQVSYQDIFIFLDGKLHWRSEPLNEADVAAALFSLMNQQDYLKRRQNERNEAVLAQVKVVVLEQLLKSKKSRPVEPKKVQDEDPYKVLGLSPGCTWDQVRKARNALLGQYHPDKVDGLGPKLRALADKETKKINAASEQLERKLRPSKKG